MYKDMSLEFKINEISMIKQVEEIFPDYDIFLFYGTLLGCVRENKLIDNDCDIDVCYLSKYHTAKEVEQELKDIYGCLIDKRLLYNYFTTDFNGYYYDEIKDEELNNEIINPFGQAHIRINNRDVDLYTSWIDEKGNFYTCYSGKLGDSSDLLPFKEGKIYNQTFKIPNKSDKILEKLYGEWETPRDEKTFIPVRPYLKEWLDAIQV